jgi:hypothetical protein
MRRRLGKDLRLGDLRTKLAEVRLASIPESLGVRAQLGVALPPERKNPRRL